MLTKILVYFSLFISILSEARSADTAKEGTKTAPLKSDTIDALSHLHCQTLLSAIAAHNIQIPISVLDPFYKESIAALLRNRTLIVYDEYGVEKDRIKFEEPLPLAKPGTLTASRQGYTSTHYGYFSYSLTADGSPHYWRLNLDTRYNGWATYTIYLSDAFFRGKLIDIASPNSYQARLQ